MQDDPVKYKDNNELRLCARAGNEGGKISAKIDGREIKDLQQYRDESGIFNLTLHPDNIFKDGAGTWKARSRWVLCFPGASSNRRTYA